MVRKGTLVRIDAWCVHARRATLLSAATTYSRVCDVHDFSFCNMLMYAYPSCFSHVQRLVRINPSSHVQSTQNVHPSCSLCFSLFPCQPQSYFCTCFIMTCTLFCCHFPGSSKAHRSRFRSKASQPIIRISMESPSCLENRLHRSVWCLRMSSLTRIRLIRIRMIKSRSQSASWGKRRLYCITCSSFYDSFHLIGQKTLVIILKMKNISMAPFRKIRTDIHVP